MVDLQNTGLAYGPTMLWIDDIDVQAKWYLKLKTRMDREPRREPRVRQSDRADDAAVDELAPRCPFSP